MCNISFQQLRKNKNIKQWLLCVNYTAFKLTEIMITKSTHISAYCGLLLLHKKTKRNVVGHFICHLDSLFLSRRFLFRITSGPDFNYASASIMNKAERLSYAFQHVITLLLHSKLKGFTGEDWPWRGQRKASFSKGSARARDKWRCRGHFITNLPL